MNIRNSEKDTEKLDAQILVDLWTSYIKLTFFYFNSSGKHYKYSTCIMTPPMETKTY